MCFADWSRPDLINLFIAIGTLLTAGFTLGLIIIANLGFKKLLSQEADKRQFLVVEDLIAVLSKIEIPINFHFIPVPLFRGKYNIFDLSRLDLLTPNLNFRLTIEHAYFNSIFEEVWKIIHHPFLPPHIADELSGLFGLGIIATFSSEEIDEPQYTIGNIPQVIGTFQRDIRIISVPLGINVLLKTCRSISKSIIDYYEANGLHKINKIAFTLPNQ